jgi:hypothetical protein
MQNRKMLIVGAAVGNCVHTSGVANFLRIARDAGFETQMLGAAIPVAQVVEVVKSMHPVGLAVSYRLTPANGRILLEQLLQQLEGVDTTVMFGGTADMVKVAREFDRIAICFTGDENFADIGRAFSLLRGEAVLAKDEKCSISILPVGARVDALMTAGDERRVPLLRHHFGLPNLEQTVKGVREIAESGVLDVISIAPDQNAQEFFFRPNEMNHAFDGAGGVPLRKPEDLDQLYEAAQCGNHPLLRIYSGTQDLLQWAEMSVGRLHNAWGTIPLTWYSELDGRSTRKLEDAIVENSSIMQWYAERDIPVEVNEAHHWSLRDAPDTVAVAMAYIAARIARKAGVRQFFAQYMFNTPSFTSPISDLAKMMAKLSLIETLHTPSFTPYRQVRAGLSHFTGDLSVAKGQLAMSSVLMLTLQPHIVHVVGFCEADHAATASDVVESCKIVNGVMRDAFLGMPNILVDPRIRASYETLIRDTLLLLGTIERLGERLERPDPLTDPVTLAHAIRCGILDAPHLAGQRCALGRVRTSPVNGSCQAVDESGCVISEGDRLLDVLCQEPARLICKDHPTRLISSSQSVFPATPPLISRLLS